MRRTRVSPRSGSTATSTNTAPNECMDHRCDGVPLIPSFAFPNDKHPPSEFPELCGHPPVPLLVLRKFAFPKFDPGAGGRISDTSLMPMPETTMYKCYLIALRKDETGRSRRCSRNL